MKTIRTNSLLLFLTFILFSCNDKLPLKKKDLEKYSWLTPFIIEHNNNVFKGYYNIDLEIIQFDFIISKKKYTDIFSHIDSVAISEKWESLKISKLKREYSKYISQEIKAGGQVKMKIEIDTFQHKLLFRIE